MMQMLHSMAVMQMPDGQQNYLMVVLISRRFSLSSVLDLVSGRSFASRTSSDSFLSNLIPPVSLVAFISWLKLFLRFLGEEWGFRYGGVRS